MGAKHARNAQLRLIALAARVVEIPPELEHRLIDALAELLMQVAASEDTRTLGGSDERQDSR
jgi:hypothetical protein